MIRQEVNTAAAVASAAPRTAFNVIGWDGLPKPIADSIAAQFGGPANAAAQLSKSNPPLVNLFAAWVVMLKGDIDAQTAWIATAPTVWQLCLQQVVTGIVDTDHAQTVGLLANSYLASAAADGFASMAKASSAIAAGAAAAHKGLSVALTQLDSQIATAKQNAASLFDAWRSSVPAKYMTLATDSVQTFEGTPSDPRFLHPLLKPDPLARGAFDPSLPAPYESGYRTPKNDAAFSPRVTFLYGGQQLASKQRILAKLDPKAVLIWNDKVRPAIQAMLDLLWIRAEVSKQDTWQEDTAGIYTKKAAEFADLAKQQAELAAKVKAASAVAIAKLLPFVATVVQSAGTKKGLALSAAKRADDSLAIQNLSIKQAGWSNELTRLQQALEMVKVKAGDLSSNVAAALQDISKANLTHAEGVGEAGKEQGKVGEKAREDAAGATAPPTTIIEVAVGGTDTGKGADELGKLADEKGAIGENNGGAIGTTMGDNTDQIVDPTCGDPPPPPAETTGASPIVWVIGLGLLAKLLLR